MDMIAHLTRQAAFSRATFGPGPRTKGVLDHVRKETVEVEKVYVENDGNPDEAPDSAVHISAAEEWVDIAILGLDGLLRAVWAARPDWHTEEIAALAVDMIENKQGVNELRDWPDWRTVDPDKAIEHDRSGEAGQPVVSEVPTTLAELHHLFGSDVTWVQPIRENEIRTRHTDGSIKTWLLDTEVED